MQELPLPRLIQVLWMEHGLLVESIAATAVVAKEDTRTTSGHLVPAGEVYYIYEDGHSSWKETSTVTLRRAGDKAWSLEYSPNNCGWCGKSSDQLYWCDDMPHPHAYGHYHEACVLPAIEWWEKNR